MSDQPLSPQEIDAIASAIARRTVEAEATIEELKVIHRRCEESSASTVEAAERDRDAAQSAIRAFLAQWDHPDGFDRLAAVPELTALRAIVTPVDASPKKE